MKTVKISLNSIDKVKAFVNENLILILTWFPVDTL